MVHKETIGPELIFGIFRPIRQIVEKHDLEKFELNVRSKNIFIDPLLICVIKFRIVYI